MKSLTFAYTISLSTAHSKADLEKPFAETEEYVKDLNIEKLGIS